MPSSYPRPRSSCRARFALHPESVLDGYVGQNGRFAASRCSFRARADCVVTVDTGPHSNPRLAELRFRCNGVQRLGFPHIRVGVPADALPQGRAPLPASPHSATTNDVLPSLSVVVPAYNEAEVIEDFQRRLSAVMDGIGLSWEVVYVDDGSSDATPALLAALQATRPEVAVVALSRNFGKEA